MSMYDVWEVVDCIHKIMMIFILGCMSISFAVIASKMGCQWKKEKSE